ncbi:MAG TPA: hypothetical protein DEU03_11540 [Bacillus sp. (in: Bacteria)]|nr:hypothetical protein [Bacillus sp. (in: firmicutes)]
MNFLQRLKTNFKDGSATDKLSIISSIVTIFGVFSIPSLIYLQYAPNFFFAGFLICMFFMVSLTIIYFGIVLVQICWGCFESTIPKIIIFLGIVGIGLFLFSIVLSFLPAAYRDVFSKITQL